MTAPDVIAHRGASSAAPENTVAAFELAVEQGADVIELDVRILRDRRVVVCHDPTLARTTDVHQHFPDRDPWELTGFDYAELKRLSAAWPDGAGGADGDPCRVPVLDEVLEALAGRVQLMIEVKQPSRQPGLVEAVADRLTRHPAWLESGALAVHSFDVEALATIRDRLPGAVRYGVVTGYDQRPDVTMLPDWVSAVAVDQVVVDAGLVGEVQDSGRRLQAWTVNDTDRMCDLLEVGIDGIITDTPDVLLALRDKYASDRAAC